MADFDDEPRENGNTLSDDDAEFASDAGSDIDSPENVEIHRPQSAIKRTAQPVPLASAPRPELPEQPDPKDLNIDELTPLSPVIIARQATINIGTIGRKEIWRIYPTGQKTK